MKQGDLVRLRSGSKHSPYSRGTIIEIVDATVRSEHTHVIAQVLWQNGVITDEILRDFVHYYEVYGEAG